MQMFERFVEERIANPKQPEILFFDESIIAKLNRSKTNITKRRTPFLSDLEGRYYQTFSPPPPRFVFVFVFVFVLLLQLYK